MIDLTVNEEALVRNVEFACRKNVLLPTLGQRRRPETIPASIAEGPNGRPPESPSAESVPHPLPHQLGIHLPHTGSRVPRGKAYLSP